MTECNVANWEGWNVASRFGFELWVVGWKAKGERNETVGWHERNGVKEALLRGLPRLGLTMNGMECKVAERSVAPEV